MWNIARSVWTEQPEKVEREESRRSINERPDTISVTSSEQKENLKTLQRVQAEPGNGLDGKEDVYNWAKLYFLDKLPGILYWCLEILFHEQGVSAKAQLLIRLMMKQDNCWSSWWWFMLLGGDWRSSVINITLHPYQKVRYSQDTTINSPYPSALV